MDFEIYVLILCILVFALLTGLFTAMIIFMVKMQVRIIENGLNDEQILEEKKQAEKNEGGFFALLGQIMPFIICIIVCVAFGFSMFTAITGDNVVRDVPTMKVVLSPSMATVHEKNTYLEKNNINNRINTFDLVFLEKLPAEMDLQLYDVVAYEVDGNVILHRIVGIEEPNATHPNERYFVLQGDAIEYRDKFPVRYSQMKGIYRDNKIPFIGSFVYFMQTPAGVLCLLLVLFSIFGVPYIEKVIKKATDERLKIITATATTTASETTLETASAEASSTEIAPQTESRNQDWRANRKRLSFAEKTVLLSSEKLAWLNTLYGVFGTVEGVRKTIGQKCATFIKGNKTLGKIHIKGKSLFVCFAVNSAEYSHKKYGVADRSQSKTFKTCPTEFKITSERRLKYALSVIVDKFGGKTPQETVGFYGRRNLSFKYKLSQLSPERKAFYKQITSFLKEKGAVRKDSKKNVCFRLNKKPLVKFVIRHKSLYAYLAVNPTDYPSKKLGVTDCSQSKGYKNYPCRIKITSLTKVNGIINIVDSLSSK